MASKSTLKSLKNTLRHTLSTLALFLAFLKPIAPAAVQRQRFLWINQDKGISDYPAHSEQASHFTP